MSSVIDELAEENKESITLVWFDPNPNEKVKTKDMMKKLRSINDYVLIETNEEECISYIKKVTNEKIFLVIPGTSANILLPRIIDLKQIEVIFIICDVRRKYFYLLDKYPKIAGIFIDQEDLNSNIRKNIRSLNKQMESFSFYDQKQTVSMDLSERTAEFLWFQLIHDVVICLPSNNQAKQEMIDTCRNYYRGNEIELKLINEFEKCYSREECIRWYTKETFVYKMINKALRTEDIQQLHTFRFYISDLSSTLARQHKKLEESHEEIITTVYRGAQLTIIELEQFRLNESKLISINGYLSTSRLRSIALHFTTNDLKRLDTLPVLFQIECQTDQSNSSIFADISQFSDFPDEQEVLFDLGTVFKVETVSKEDNLWKICLNVTDDGREIAKQYIEETRKEMEGDSVVLLFGRLMTRMGHYKSAETYFLQLLKDPGNENPAHIHNQLGLIYEAKAEFHPAMHHFNTAYRLMKRSDPPFLKDSAHVLLNMSQILREQGYYNKALEHSIRAKQVLTELNDSNELEMAHCLHSIGSCYRDQRQYYEALNHYEQALTIKRAYLSENHIYIAKTLNSIGLVYLMTKDIEKAFNYYISSLEMYQSCLPEDHPDIANALHNIAQCYHKKNQLDRSLQHYQLALTMKEKCCRSDHPSIAMTLNNISNLLNAQGDKVKALELCLKALSIRERLLPFGHPDLAISFHNVGLRYETLKDDEKALKYFEKALEIRKIFLSEDDLLRKNTENHILRIKQKLM
ncbi:unnamed protein product [Adineta steineri]|uniref:NAD(P)(+)--arginine ADP-ribosyltransferase n=1 Tax=Adineta steineri TaxID=433720 RepID=A0A819CR97_9BILA|nr:unnamed protein product [Adineta steineri]CAF3816797.1 unnamed protein product [Adineta steineri]